ncbi:MAG: hypothetical protein ACLSTO_00690 [Bilophila wadsworthia]
MLSGLTTTAETPGNQEPSFKKNPRAGHARIGKRIVDGPDRFDGNEDGVVPRRARFRQAAYGLVAEMSVFVVGCGDLPVHGGKRLSEPQGDTRAAYGFVLCGECPAFRESPVAAERDHIRGRPHSGDAFNGRRRPAAHSDDLPASGFP